MQEDLKLPYKNATIETVSFSERDVITTSGEQENPGGWTEPW